MTVKKENPLFEIDEEHLYNLVHKVSSYSEIAAILGRPNDTRVIKQIKNKIKELDLDIQHWGCPKIKKVISIKDNLYDILVENSNFSSKTKLKEVLIKERILEHCCYICFLPPIWNQKTLVLQLDHINGNNRDNRIENLRLLCGNCHSQTSTYCRGTKTKNYSF